MTMTLTACTTYRSVFDLCLQDEAFGLKEVTTVQPLPPDPSSDKEADLPVCPEDGTHQGRSLVREVPDLMVCTACRSSFNNREEQMEHYKLDWHRFNLRQKMMGLLPVTADEFEKKTGTGDMSSISGSESDSGDEDTEDSDSDCAGRSSDVTRTDNEGALLADLVPCRLSNKVVFQDLEGHYLAVYRCVLQGKSDDEVDRVASLRTISNKTVWVVLMTGGGHFAAAVFKGKEVLQHKTFHRYTVRAKRGTAQGLRDAQNRSHAPKSAGATLRRHNEAALVKEIQDLLESWADHINEASAIFLRAPSYNKSIFFGGRVAPLSKKDPRIRVLPFATRRATFREVQRVHEVLSTVHVYGKDMDLSVIFSPSKKVWKKAKKSTAEPETNQSDSVPEKAGGSVNSGDDENSGDIQLETVEMTLGTLDLREFEIQPSRHRRRRKKKESGRKMEIESLNACEGHEKVVQEEEDEEEVLGASSTDDLPQEKLAKNKRRRKVQNKKKHPAEGAHPAEEADESWEYGVRDALYTACKIGDVESLRGLLHLAAADETAGKESAGELGSNSSHQQQSPDGDFSPLHLLLNKPVDSTGFTLLHVASAAGQKAVVRLLMDVGADPASRDNKGQTPYVVAPEKEIRNVFRKFMGENPDKYDYSKAQVPGPLNAEIESKQMEKKKAQKAAKKQREKEQKEEKRKQEFEAEEKRRFASLTDREKRALAAERRMAEQAAATGVTVSNVKRCWTCGESLLGKIPFQYLDYSFCTTRCVQAHRKASTPAAKT